LALPPTVVSSVLVLGSFATSMFDSDDEEEDEDVHDCPRRFIAS
jgi:hypothetical protein